jgi:ComF family protein
MHALKYKNHPEIGAYFGTLLGKQLRSEANFQNIKAVVAVPLHYKKEQQRGYNQSNLIAASCAEAMGVPFYSKALIRKRFTQTQTQKTRSERVDNMEAAFFINNSNLFVNKHILIIDDVLTTGATMEACALQLLKLPGTQVSIATIGIVI